MQRVIRQADEYNLYNMRIYGGVKKSSIASSTRWSASHSGIIKINSDACIGDDGWVGLGVVSRISYGKIWFLTVRRIRA